MYIVVLRNFQHILLRWIHCAGQAAPFFVGQDRIYFKMDFKAYRSEAEMQQCDMDWTADWTQRFGTFWKQIDQKQWTGFLVSFQQMFFSDVQLTSVISRHKVLQLSGQDTQPETWAVNRIGIQAGDFSWKDTVVKILEKNVSAPFFRA